MNRACSVALQTLGTLVALLLVACGGSEDEGVARAERTPATESTEVRVAPPTPATADIQPETENVAADETLGRVVTRGGVVEVGIAFEGRVRRLLVSVGQPIAEGSVLAEVEVPAEVPSYEEFVVARESGKSRLLVEHRHLHPKLIAVDGVYSVSTELAPIRELQALCEAYDAFLYVDDAHGFGILGRDPSAQNPYGTTGSGCITHAGGGYDRTFYVAGFAKSFCAATAFATIPDRFADRVRSFALSYLFSNPSTPHTLGMCDAALELNEQRGEAARARIRELVSYLVESLRSEGLRVHNNKLQPVVFLEVGPLDDLIAVGRALDAGGIISGYRAYPVVPEDQCGLRFALTAGHERRHLDRLLELLCAPANRARMRSA